jgi:hypothetical protein
VSPNPLKLNAPQPPRNHPHPRGPHPRHYPQQATPREPKLVNPPPTINIPLKKSQPTEGLLQLCSHHSRSKIGAAASQLQQNRALITNTPRAPNFLKTLQVAANSTSINYAPINRKTAGLSSASKKPTFSVVIRDVPQDIPADDIGTLCPSLSIGKAWRIISRKTNRATSFIRVLSTDNKTVDDMLINGVALYGRTFECETSHPLQCPRCFQFGHGQADCTNKPICPESHLPNRCPAKEPSCSTCNGPHPAWSRACPSFKKIQVTDETPVLPVKIVDPLTAIVESADTESNPSENDATITIIKSLLTFMTKTLFDLFPMQRSKIQSILENTSKSVFNVVTKVSHSGHKIHFTFDQ